jgi:hypothetical protein
VRLKRLRCNSASLLNVNPSGRPILLATFKSAKPAFYIALKVCLLLSHSTSSVLLLTFVAFFHITVSSYSNIACIFKFIYTSPSSKFNFNLTRRARLHQRQLPSMLSVPSLGLDLTHLKLASQPSLRDTASPVHRWSALDIRTSLCTGFDVLSRY